MLSLFPRLLRLLGTALGVPFFGWIAYVVFQMYFDSSTITSPNWSDFFTQGPGLLFLIILAVAGICLFSVILQLKSLAKDIKH
jgi:energy-coupling factor transporter transmembrane protein EcfT